jgi:hypothetical protein
MCPPRVTRNYVDTSGPAMRIKLVIFCVLAVFLPVMQIGKLHLNWRGWLLVGILVVGAVGFAALLTRGTPSTTGIRFLAYGCAVVVAQGYGIANAIIALINPDASGVPPPAPTSKDVVLGIAAGTFSLWTFLLVRTWVSRGIRKHVPHKHDSRSRITRYPEASLAVLAVLIGFFAADMVKTVFSNLAGTTFNPNMHPKAGEAADWIAVTADTSVAGLREEPVYIGIAALLFPAAYRSRMSFVKIAAITSFARALLHIYYASGQEHTILGLGSILLWCAIWSTANLVVFYWTKNLVPIIIGHGISNVFVTNDSGDWKLVGAWPTAIQLVELIAILSVVIGALIYMFYMVIDSRKTFIEARRRKKAQAHTAGDG